MNSNISSMWVDYKFRNTSQRLHHWKLPICIISWNIFVCLCQFINNWVKWIKQSLQLILCLFFKLPFESYLHTILIRLLVLFFINNLYINWILNVVFVSQFCGCPFLKKFAFDHTKIGIFFCFLISRILRCKRYSPKWGLFYIMSVIAHIMVQ